MKYVAFAVIFSVIMSSVLACSRDEKAPPASASNSTSAMADNVTPTDGSGGTVATAPQNNRNGPAASLQLPNIADVTEAVRPAVAAITVRELAPEFFLQPVQPEGAGTGVIFDSDGHILTNNHVVEGSRNIRVTLPDGRTFDGAKVIGRDPPTDLAVIKIEGDNLPVAALGDSDNLRVGDWVIAIGNALGLRGGPTVTVGVVGALDRSIQASDGPLHDLIQTDAAINPGNSGGPLLDLQGRVVGINTAIDTRGQGIGFAISISSAKPIIEQLLGNGRVVWPWIGIGAVTVTPGIASELNIPNMDGVLVAGVQVGGPAEKAGLREMDIITHLDGIKVSTVRQLQEAIRQHKEGDTVEITLVREGDEMKMQITLAEMPRGL